MLKFAQRWSQYIEFNHILYIFLYHIKAIPFYYPGIEIPSCNLTAPTLTPPIPHPHNRQPPLIPSVGLVSLYISQKVYLILWIPQWTYISHVCIVITNIESAAYQARLGTDLVHVRVQHFKRYFIEIWNIHTLCKYSKWCWNDPIAATTIVKRLVKTW